MHFCGVPYDDVFSHVSRGEGPYEFAMDDAGGCFEIVVLPTDRGGGSSEAGLAGQVRTSFV